ncbi:MAG TPA: hypothetical protein G4N92_01875 [Anaerolineae bacterium]|nr:hypothetical protein [Anaerolineae bacterium]
MLNPDKKIKRQNTTFWTIWFPLVLFIILTILGGYMIFRAIVYGTSDMSLWVDIAIIILLAPLTLSLIILLITLAIFIFFLHESTIILITELDSLSHFVINILNQATYLLTLLVKPFILIDSFNQILSQSVKTLNQNNNTQLDQEIELN